MIKVVQMSSVHKTFDTRVFFKVCRSLVDAGYEVDLIIQHEKPEKINGVNIIPLRRVKSKILRFFVIIPALFLKAVRYPRKTILHFHDPELIPVGILLKLLGYKIIYDVHEDVPKDILTKPWIPAIIRRPLSKIIELMEATGATFFDGIVTVVEPITERFKKNSNSVVEIRNYPIIKMDGDEFQSEEEIKDEYVIYVGDLTSRRGISKLVDAISLVRKETVKLWLGGVFSEEGLEDNLKSKPGWKRTNHLGWLNQEQIRLYLKNAKCGLMTLEKIPTHEESLNVKMFEYMLAEIPVISTDLRFPTEIIKNSESGIILEENSPQKIAEAIDWICENPKESRRMGLNGRKTVLEKYSWVNEEVKLIKFYKSLLTY